MKHWTSIKLKNKEILLLLWTVLTKSGACTGSIVATLRSNPKYKITTSNETAGTSKQLTLYSAKLGALFGGLCLLKVVCCLHCIKTGSVDLGLDGELVMMKSASKDWLVNLALSFDLIYTIRF